MSVFGGIIRAAGGGATSDPVSDPRLWTGLSIGGRQTTAGEWIDGETALTLPGYYAAIRNISEDIGKISLKILRRDGENKVEDRVHPLWTLLHDDPNPEMSSMGFRETLTQWALSWGNGYAEIVRNGAGVPVALYPLHPSRVRFKRRQNGDPYYEVRADDALKRLGVSTFNAVTIEPSGMFHVRGLGTGNEGYSAFRLMAETLGRAMAIRKFGSAFFANGLNAQVMLEHPTVLGDDAIRHLRESLASQHGGSENAHGVFIAEEGMKIQKISVPPEEAQAIEQEQFLLEDVCRVLRMPPHKVQNLARSTFSNIEHQSIEYVVDTIFPWVRRWEDEIRRKLFVGSSRTTHFAEFALESLLRADSKARAEFYALMQSWGNYTINDVLRKENLPTAGPSGDVRLVPMNMTTLDRLIEGPPPPKPSPEPKPEQKPEPKRERDREAATMSGTRMFSAVIDRCSAKRTKAATAAATKHAGDGPAFGAWCDKFLAQHDEEMVASLIPVAEGFAMLIGAADPAQLIGRYSVGVCAGFGQVLKAAHEEGAVPLACEAWRTPEYAVNEGAKIAAAIVAAAGDDQ